MTAYWFVMACCTAVILWAAWKQAGVSDRRELALDAANETTDAEARRARYLDLVRELAEQETRRQMHTRPAPPTRRTHHERPQYPAA